MLQGMRLTIIVFVLSMPMISWAFMVPSFLRGSISDARSGRCDAAAHRTDSLNMQVSLSFAAVFSRVESEHS